MSSVCFLIYPSCSLANQNLLFRTFQIHISWFLLNEVLQGVDLAGELLELQVLHSTVYSLVATGEICQCCYDKMATLPAIPAPATIG